MIKYNFVLIFVVVFYLNILPIQAQDTYRGVIVNKSNNTNTNNTKTGYRGLISGNVKPITPKKNTPKQKEIQSPIREKNNYNKSKRTTKPVASSKARQVFKSKSQKLKEGAMKRQIRAVNLQRRLNYIEGKTPKTFEELKKEEINRAKKHKKYMKLLEKNPDLLRQSLYIYPIQRKDKDTSENSKSSDENYSSYFSQFAGLEDIDIEAMKDNFNRREIIKLENKMLEAIRLPKSVIRVLNGKYENDNLSDGESIDEELARKEIERYFKKLEIAKKLNRKERKELYKRIDEHLEAMRIRYQFKKDTPKSILVKIGFPKRHIEKRQNDLKKVIAMIDRAQKSFRKYKMRNR